MTEKEKAPVRIDLYEEEECDTKMLTKELNSVSVKARLQQREESFRQKQFRTGEEEAIRDKNQEQFFTPFEELVNSFTKLLNTISTTPSAKEVDNLLEIHKNMQDLLSIHSVSLPSYDLKQSQSTIDQLKKQLIEKRKKAAPKKFSFKKKTTGAKKTTANPISAKPIETTDKKIETTTIIDPKHQVSEMNNNSIVVSVTETKIGGKTLDEQKQLDSEFVVCDSSNATIALNGIMQTLRLSQLRECEVKGGPVTRSIMISNCTDCTIYVASQQIRIHDCTNCTFYILCKSKPIIEDCSSLRFGCYNYEYHNSSEDLKVAALSKIENQWNDVQDFNWLKSTPSPNFSLLK